ncbi:MAG: hypothetical protein Q8T11_13215 [Elusimicrobiota bacterium]|nr:hypothetical protein [Elusimicrobiota bacterium]
MSLRTAGLAIVALLILLWAVARYRDVARAVPPAPPAPVAAPAPPPPAPVKKARVKVVAKAPAPPAAPAKIRGAKLRDKGEAFGGGMPDQ